MSLLAFVKHFHVTGWGWYWVIWFFGGFGVAEAIGLVKNTQDTLSWQLWGLEQIDFKHPFDFAEWTAVHWALGTVLLVFVIWLGGHLILGLWH